MVAVSFPIILPVFLARQVALVLHSRMRFACLLYQAGLSKKVGATTGSAPLKFYTHPISQPCRSVQALLDAVAIPYEYIKVDIMKGEQKAAPYVAINPTKKIPTLVDNGLNLGEAAAILIYLAEKYELEQYYPKDPVARGKINFWLHWNHTNSRSLTLKLLVPVIFKTVVDEVRCLLVCLCACVCLCTCVCSRWSPLLQWSSWRPTSLPTRRIVS